MEIMLGIAMFTVIILALAVMILFAKSKLVVAGRPVCREQRDEDHRLDDHRGHQILGITHRTRVDQAAQRHGQACQVRNG